MNIFKILNFHNFLVENWRYQR